MSNPTPTVAVAVLLLVAGASALPAISAEETLVTVSNAAPVVVSVTLPASALDPVAGGVAEMEATIIVEDLNGYNDVTGVTVEVLKPDGSTHTAPAAATFVESLSGTEGKYVHTIGMAFHDAPALSTSAYKLRVVVTDKEGATGSNAGDLALFNYNELVALGLDATTVDFGTALSPGASSAVRDLTVTNRGNVAIGTEVSGTDLAHATENAAIPVGSVAYATSSDMQGKVALAGTAAAVSGFTVSPGSASAGTLHWQLTVPSGSAQWVPSGGYTGTLTVAAVKG